MPLENYIYAPFKPKVRPPIPAYDPALVRRTEAPERKPLPPRMAFNAGDAITLHCPITKKAGTFRVICDQRPTPYQREGFVEVEGECLTCKQTMAIKLRLNRAQEFASAPLLHSYCIPTSSFTKIATAMESEVVANEVPLQWHERPWDEMSDDERQRFIQREIWLSAAWQREDARMMRTKMPKRMKPESVQKRDRAICRKLETDPYMVSESMLPEAMRQLPHTRDAARSAGKRHYTHIIQGHFIPCPHGHISVRYASTGACHRCDYERKARRKAAHQTQNVEGEKPLIPCIESSVPETRAHNI